MVGKIALHNSCLINRTQLKEVNNGSYSKTPGRFKKFVG